MAAEIAEWQAMEQARKSLLNKIERAKNNIPSCGKLPFGRMYDRKTNKWSLDKRKADMIKNVASKYLAGTHTMIGLAKTYGMASSSLWRILNTRSGDTWEVSFKSFRLNIDQPVTYKVPRLLSDRTIKAIKERSASNRTCVHGFSKHKYLLSRMVFCKKCGHGLSGQTQKEKHRYYLQWRKKKRKKIPFNYPTPPG